MAAIEIIGLPVSNYVRVVRMVCEEKGIEYSVTPSLPHAPEVIDIHPFGKIPVLRHGDVELSESKAIATYLDKLFPVPALFPTDPVPLAQTEQWVSLVNTVMDRTMIREYVLSYVFAQRDGREPDRRVIDAALPALQQQVEVLGRAVEKRGYLVGDQFTFADVNIMPTLAGIQRYPEGREAVAGSPALTAYFEAHASRPSFRATEAPHVPQ